MPITVGITAGVGFVLGLALPSLQVCLFFLFVARCTTSSDGLLVRGAVALQVVQSHRDLGESLSCGDLSDALTAWLGLLCAGVPPTLHHVRLFQMRRPEDFRVFREIIQRGIL